MAKRVVTGDKAIDRKLSVLGDKAARRVAYAAIRSGLVVAKRAIKNEIPGHMKEARKAVGSRFKKAKTGRHKGTAVAKVGGGVGKQKPGKDRGTKGGVGISAQNIHWLLIGTDDRTQDTTGRFTGKMETRDYVPKGFTKSESAVRAKIVQRIDTLIEKEIIKAARSK